MTRKLIPTDEFTIDIHKHWNDRWFLLTSGDFQKSHFNTMTVAWGSTGIMWGKPFVQVVVRMSRYTLEFLEKYDSFTLCAFAPEQRDTLLMLGTKSGRDSDKIKESGLTPIASAHVTAPGFAEAELIIEARKMYWQDMAPAQFLDPTIEEQYPNKDYHRIYFGEVLAIWGDPPRWTKGK